MLSNFLARVHPVVDFLSTLPIEALLKLRGSAPNPTQTSSSAEEGVSAQNLPPTLPIFEGGESAGKDSPPTAVPPAPTPQRAKSLSNEEILAYQNFEIASETWQLEKHLAQKCRIFGKPCDCCEKGTFIGGLALETIPIAARVGATIEPYEQLVAWLRKHQAKFSVEAVASNQYNSEYGKLAGELSLLRKRIMPNKPLATGPAPQPPEPITLEEAKKLAAQFFRARKP